MGARVPTMMYIRLHLMLFAMIGIMSTVGRSIKDIVHSAVYIDRLSRYVRTIDMPLVAVNLH